MSERSQQLRRDTAGKELEEIRKDYKPMTVKLIPINALPDDVLAERARLREARQSSTCTGCIYDKEGRDSQGAVCWQAPDCADGVFQEVP
jgi:hypothetical protein